MSPALERSRVTMSHVGALAGVSDRTVSNVLSGKAKVRPETREAVLNAVRELGYSMNASARSLRTGRTGFITLAIPDLSIDYFTELARAVLRQADALHWAVIIQQTGLDLEVEKAVLLGSNRQLSDGLLFQPHLLRPEHCVGLKLEQPMVLLGELGLGQEMHHVTMDNGPAAHTATSYLLRTGRCSIAIIGPHPSGAPHTAETQRLAGYQQALSESDVRPRDELVGYALHWRRADGAAAVHDLLDRGVDLDAVFCMNDSLALGALHALSRRGVRVPDDVAVIGFDNVSAAQYSTPTLTSIDPSVEDIARESVRLLAHQTSDQAAPPVARTIGHQLIFRESA